MRGIRANIKRNNNQDTQQSQYNKEEEASNSRGYYTIQNQHEGENDYYQDHSQYHRNPTLNNRDKEERSKPAESYRMENEVIQKEARALVEKTKKMIGPEY